MHKFRNGLARSPIMEGIFLVLLLFTKILFFLKNSGGFSQGNQPPSIWISDYLSSSFIIIIGCCYCCCDDGIVVFNVQYRKASTVLESSLMEVWFNEIGKSMKG